MVFSASLSTKKNDKDWPKMKVQVYLENDLWRSSASPKSKKHLLVFEYQDDISKTAQEALNRAWHITSGAIMRLNPQDLEIRTRWEKILPGMVISVGDEVAVNSIRYRCLPKGWKKI